MVIFNSGVKLPEGRSEKTHTYADFPHQRGIVEASETNGRLAGI